MTSIPRQLAIFFAVLAVLYAAGAIAGQFIEPEPHDESRPAQEQTEGHGEPAAPHRPEPEGDR